MKNNFVLKLRWSLGLTIGLLSLQGCLQYQSQQSTLTPLQYTLVNPPPTQTSPEESNRQHEILIAVIDTGVDYNHPYLSNSVHYQLDTEGKIVGAGWDFFAQDAFPAPYLARTADNQKGLSFETKSKIKHARALAAKMAKKYPSVAQKLNPERAVEEEFMNAAYHGTHVAGLASFDEPRIGIIPLRVNLAFPGNLKFEQQQQMIDQAVDNMMLAIKKGYSLGARIFNMSLSVQAMLNGKSIYQTADTSKKATEAYSEIKQEIFNLNQIRVQKFSQFLSQYPDIVIVAASGNSGVYLEEEQASSLPCGVPTNQILCVGSVDQSLTKVSGFSNIPQFKLPFVFAPGELMKSTFPTMMCPSSMNRMAKAFLPWYLSGLSSVSDERNWDNFARSCLVERLVVPSDGTSMASPMAARAYARFILKYNKTVSAESLQSFTINLKQIEFKGKVFPVVPMQRPSWIK